MRNRFVWRWAAVTTILAVAAAAILLSVGAQAQDSVVLPGWVQEDWTYWTQGTGRWITDNSAFKGANEPYDAYGTEWKWGLGRKSLKGRLFAMKDGKEVGTIWEYHSYWHPGEKRVALMQFGSDGTLGTGTMKELGEKQTEAVERFFAPDASTYQVGHRTTRKQGEVETQSYNVSEDGKWEKRRLYVWKLESGGK